MHDLKQQWTVGHDLLMCSIRLGRNSYELCHPSQATIFLFLAGGADTWNMWPILQSVGRSDWHPAFIVSRLVPQDCDLYQARPKGSEAWKARRRSVPVFLCCMEEYVDVRTDLHLDPEDLIAINVSNQPCPKFGIHGSFDYLKQLYVAASKRVPPLKPAMFVRLRTRVTWPS